MKDSFPLSRIYDFLDKLRDAKYMAQLDLRSAYYHVQMSNDGAQDESIVAKTFQGHTPNGSSF